MLECTLSIFSHSTKARGIEADENGAVSAVSVIECVFRAFIILDIHKMDNDSHPEIHIHIPR